MTYLAKHKTLSNPALGDDSWSEGVQQFNPLVPMSTIVDNVMAALRAVQPGDPSVAGDNINAASGGGTSISAADFNASNCKPANLAALNAVKNLQLQLNRIGSVKGMGTIGVDGQIGPATLSLFKKVQAAFSSQLSDVDASSCLNVSADADVTGDVLKSIADGLGAPATVPTPSAKISTIVTKSGKIVTAPGETASISQALSGVSVTQALVLLGVLGAGAYFVLGRKKGRRR